MHKPQAGPIVDYGTTFALSTDQANVLTPEQKQQLTHFNNALLAMSSDTSEKSTETIALIADAIRNHPRFSTQNFSAPLTQDGNLDIIRQALGKPLCEVFLRHKKTSAQQYTDFFFAATNYVDVVFMTPFRNIEVFAPLAEADVFGTISDTFAHPDMPAVDLSVGGLTLLFSLPNVVTEITQQLDKSNLRKWHIVKEKLDTAARDRWFKQLYEAHARTKATKDTTTEATLNEEVERKKGREKEEEKNRARANALVDLLFEYFDLDQANSYLFGNQYTIAVNIKTNSLHLVRTPPRADNDEDGAEAQDGDDDLESKKDGDNQPPPFQKPAILSSIESSVHWQRILVLAKGSLIYGMSYWLLWFLAQHLPEFQAATLSMPWLSPLILFGIPLLFTVPYLILKFTQDETQQQKESEEDLALRMALDYAHLKKQLDIAKQEVFNANAIGLLAESEPKSSDTNALSKTYGATFAKLQQDSLPIINIIAKNGLKSADAGMLLHTFKQGATDTRIQDRTDQVKKYFEKIKGTATLSSENTRARFHAVLGAFSGIALSLVFAWPVLDAFGAGAILATGNTSAGFNPYQLLVDPVNFQMPIVMPLTIILFAVVLFATIYTALSRYWDSKEKFHNNQNKLNAFFTIQQQNDDAVSTIDDLAQQCITLATDAAQKKCLLENLKKALEEIHRGYKQMIADRDDHVHEIQNPDAEAKVAALVAIMAKTAPIDLPQFDGRYHKFLGFTLHSDSYFRRQEDTTDSGKDAFRIGASKFFRRLGGLVEGIGTGSLIVRTVLFVFMTLLPTVIPLNLLQTDMNALWIVFGVSLGLGLIVGTAKFIRDHLAGQQARRDKFIEELPLRQCYLVEENKFLDTQINYINGELLQFSQTYGIVTNMSAADPNPALTQAATKEPSGYEYSTLHPVQQPITNTYNPENLDHLGGEIGPPPQGAPGQANSVHM